VVPVDELLLYCSFFMMRIDLDGWVVWSEVLLDQPRAAVVANPLSFMTALHLNHDIRQ
jgi:hypothetical protein